MIRFILSFFGAIFTLLTLGVALIALSIGAVFWVYGRDLPSHESLAQYKPPTISRIYSGEGHLIDEFSQERRLFAPADEIPDLIKQAFISAEDKNFYSHKGYDTRGIAAAAIEAVQTRGETVRGASTITQQLIKNKKVRRGLLGVYMTALDLLRKAEKNLTDHLTQQRELLPASEVKTWMSGMITAAKQTLLNIPGKLAPQLENQPWPKIQKRLEEEIRFALEKISSNPG